MNIALVSGGAGFIGSHLARALIAQGRQVRVFDNFSSGRRANLANLDVEIVAGDIRDGEQIQHVLKNVDVVFHQAAFISVPQSIEDPQGCFDVNIQGTLNLLEACRGTHVKKVVLASSCAVYGDSNHLPLSEDEPLSPLSPYAVSKQANEIFARLYTNLYGLPVVALRYFNVYGPRQAPDSPYAAVIPIFIHHLLEGTKPVIYGDGSQRRDFVYVEDVVRANLLAMQVEEAAGKTINICTGHETSLLELVDELEHIFSDPPPELKPLLAGQHPTPARHTPARVGDIQRSLGNPGLAAGLLGFQAQTDIHLGLCHTIAAAAADLGR